MHDWHWLPKTFTFWQPLYPHSTFASADRQIGRRQAEDTCHLCHAHQPAPIKQPEIEEDLPSCSPALSPPHQAARLALWEVQRTEKQHLATLSVPTNEQLVHLAMNMNGSPSTDFALVRESSKLTWVMPRLHLVYDHRRVTVNWSYPSNRTISLGWHTTIVRFRTDSRSP